MDSLDALLVAAVSIGFFHTAAGPDHYLPFIAMAKARDWSMGRTAIITVLCGIGHVASSIVLGFVGIALGTAVGALEIIESTRGNLAAWALIAFGLVYFVWGIRRAVKNNPHSHGHGHSHTHGASKKGMKELTPWVLFTIFVFGPCEPLIPILMYPAAESSLPGLLFISGAVPIPTMLAIVMAATYGWGPLPPGRLARYSHSLAGGTILASGLAIQFLGL